VRIVHDSRTDKPRGYAFLEYLSSRDLKSAFKSGDGLKVAGRRVVADVERGRLVPGWKPRRLGGGLGAVRSGGRPVILSGRAPAANYGPPLPHFAGEEAGARDEPRRRSRERSREPRRRERSRSRERDRDRRDEPRRERRRSRSRSRERREEPSRRSRERRRSRSRSPRDRRDRERDRERGGREREGGHKRSADEVGGVKRRRDEPVEEGELVEP